jgi:hypothetical protein
MSMKAKLVKVVERRVNHGVGQCFQAGVRAGGLCDVCYRLVNAKARAVEERAKGAADERAAIIDALAEYVENTRPNTPSIFAAIDIIKRRK